MPSNSPTAHPGQGNRILQITNPKPKRAINAPSRAARLSGKLRGIISAGSRVLKAKPQSTPRIRADTRQTRQLRGVHGLVCRDFGSHANNPQGWNGSGVKQLFRQFRLVSIRQAAITVSELLRGSLRESREVLANSLQVETARRTDHGYDHDKGRNRRPTRKGLQRLLRLKSMQFRMLADSFSFQDETSLRDNFLLHT